MTEIIENTTPPKKIGRPTEYTTDKADEICALIAEGKTIRTICLIDVMPSTRTFYKWLRQNEEFVKLYTRAKEDQADALAEELLDISDDGSNDWMEINVKGQGKKIVLDKEHVARSKLRIDARKFLMAKMKPKRYGDNATIRQQLLDKDGEPADPHAPVGKEIMDKAEQLIDQAIAQGKLNDTTPEGST